VFLDSYYIQQTEVTRAQFQEFLHNTEFRLSSWDGSLETSLPATGILWKEASAYCEWLGMRLPTEAEWERAARGEEANVYPWGDEWNSLLANSAESGVSGVLPVGSFPEGASPYGLLDMAGNATEWVADYYDSTYYFHSPASNPSGPTIVMDHVLRGGSFASPPEQLTTFFRNSSHSVLPNPRVGFRCAISVVIEQ
jgi:formylglycine-generating enzyme required for sulfatase activity